MNKQFARLAPKFVAGAAAVAAAGSALAEDPVSAIAGLQSLTTSSTGFGPVLWGLAVTTVGIMIGIKWIKRGRGAA